MSSTTLRRRSLVAGAAWALLAVAVAAQAPSLAASAAPADCPTCLTTAPTAASFRILEDGVYFMSATLGLYLDASACTDYPDLALRLDELEVDLRVPDAGDLWTFSAPRTYSVASTGFVTVGSGKNFATTIPEDDPTYLTTITAPNWPAATNYSAAPGVDVATAAIVTVRYIGTYRYTLDGVPTTRRITISQPYCAQGQRDVTLPFLAMDYRGTSCPTLGTSTCADL